MAKKARDYLTEQGWKIFGGIVSVIIIVAANGIYNKSATAEEKAEAATTEIGYVKQHIENMSQGVADIKQIAKEISQDVAILRELVIRHDKDIEFAVKERIDIEKRLDRLEK